MITDIHSEDRLVQATFADHLRDVLGWESIYAYNEEPFGPNGTLGRENEQQAVLVRDLMAAVNRLNEELTQSARQQPVEKLTRVDFSRSLIQQNKDFHDFIRNGVPVDWRDAAGQTHHARARVIDFRNAAILSVMTFCDSRNFEISWLGEIQVPSGRWCLVRLNTRLSRHKTSRNL